MKFVRIVIINKTKPFEKSIKNVFIKCFFALSYLNNFWPSFMDVTFSALLVKSLQINCSHFLDYFQTHMKVSLEVAKIQSFYQ